MTETHTAMTDHEKYLARLFFVLGLLLGSLVTALSILEIALLLR